MHFFQSHFFSGLGQFNLTRPYGLVRDRMEQSARQLTLWKKNCEVSGAKCRDAKFQGEKRRGTKNGSQGIKAFLPITSETEL